ncbi:MAG: DUF885 family protein [Gammaproteobacteria bacterium]
MTRIPTTFIRPLRRRAAVFCFACLFALSLLPGPAGADSRAAPAQLVTDYIAAWKAFYPSQAFGYGDTDSAAAFEDFGGERVSEWLALNARVADAAGALLADTGLDAGRRTDLLMLQAQATGEQAAWREDDPLARQPQWYAEQVSQALTHLLVRAQLAPAAREAALLERLRGVARLCRLGVERLEGGDALRTQTALRTLAGTRSFYESGLPALLETWPASAASGERGPAIAESTAAIRALEAHLEALLPGLPADPSIGADRYAAKLARRSGGRVTPAGLREDALAEVHRVRGLMVEEAQRWQESLDDTSKAPPELADAELLVRALEAMDADREDNQADFLAQFERLTAASERFVVDKAIATVPTPTTLYVALSPAHFSGAAVGGVYPSGPFDPGADTLFYVPSVPDDAPAAAREGFYRSFNDHFNAMIISHEMFPGHYLQYKVAVTEAPAVRSLFPDGAYIEGWGSFVEELLLDAGWAGNAPLTRLAHLRKRLENATRAYVSVQVHTAGWGREQVLAFARDEGLLAPQFAENLWQRVVNSPLQITDYYVGWAQFQALYVARGDGPLRDWVDAVLRAGPVPLELLPPLLND